MWLICTSILAGGDHQELSGRKALSLPPSNHRPLIRMARFRFGADHFGPVASGSANDTHSMPSTRLSLYAPCHGRSSYRQLVRINLRLALDSAKSITGRFTLSAVVNLIKRFSLLTFAVHAVSVAKQKKRLVAKKNANI